MKTHLCYCSLIVLVFLQACSSHDDCSFSEIEYPNQNSTVDSLAYQEIRADCRQSKLQEFEFQNIEETQIEGEDGTVIIIPPGIFQSATGGVADENLTLSLIEMYNPGDIIACQLSTNGINNEGSIEPLLSEGIIYINVTYNGESIEPTEGLQIFIPSENQNLDLSAFTSPSCNEMNCKVLWENQPNTFVEPYIYEDPATNATIDGYILTNPSLGWLNFARYNPNSEPRGTIYDIAPPNYSLDNSDVYLNYHSNSIAVSMFSEYDSANEIFSEKYNQIPIGTEGDVIFLTGKEGNYSFDSAPIITEDSIITVTRNIQSGNKDEVVNYINNL